MPTPFFWIAMISLAGAAVSGFFGFVYYPALAKKKKRKKPLPKQGLARTMFIVFAMMAFVALFFGLFANY